MEIHAPESPVNSFKDFLVHISIVTVGILIALGLEGIRETIHNHHLVRETREGVRVEMEAMSDHAVQECSRVGAYSRTLAKLADALPALAAQHPEQVRAALNSDMNPGFFFNANSYQVALSTGVLAHMSPAEVSAYAYAAEATANYSTLQKEAIAAESRAKANVAAHTKPNPDALAAEAETVLLFARAENNLNYVCPQMQGDVSRALRAAGGTNQTGRER